MQGRNLDFLLQRVRFSDIHPSIVVSVMYIFIHHLYFFTREYFLGLNWMRIRCLPKKHFHINMEIYRGGHRLGLGSGPNPWTGRTDGWNIIRSISNYMKVRFCSFTGSRIGPVSVQFKRFMWLVLNVWPNTIIGHSFVRNFFFLPQQLSLYPNI
jgi:hypothetical protein